jgi:hypothetical protein
VLGPVPLDVDIDAAGIFDEFADAQFGSVAAERHSCGFEPVSGDIRDVRFCCGFSLRLVMSPRSLQQRSSVNEGS